MSFSLSLTRRIAAIIGLIVITAAATAAQTPDITIVIGNAEGHPGQSSIPVDIYLDNPTATVAGFQVWVMVDRPDLVTVDRVARTVINETYWRCLNWAGDICVDSLMVNPVTEWDFMHVDTTVQYICPLDSDSTLVSDWEFLAARSISSDGTDISITGIADLPSGTVTPPLAPQTGGTLIKMFVNVQNIPDSMTDRTAILYVSLADFSDPTGTPITNVATYEGTFTVLESCGMVYDQSYNIAKLIQIVDYMFSDGSPVTLHDADCNCDCVINIADLICLVDWMFEGGDEPNCPPPTTLP